MPSNQEWAWREKALCKKYKDIDFFSEDIGAIRKSISICNRCPVIAECLHYAITKEEVFGVWGGISQRNRRPLHRKYKQSIDIGEAREIVINNGKNVSVKND